MLNKNTNCYNIESNFKHSTAISTFSEHITIFRTLSIDIWQFKCQQRQTNKTKNCKLFFSKFCRIIKLFLFVLLGETSLESKVASTNNNVELFSIFSQTVFVINCRHQNKNNFVEPISCFVSQLKKKNITYIMCLNT